MPETRNWHRTIDRHGLSVWDHNADHPAGGAIACMNSNYEDAMGGTFLPGMEPSTDDVIVEEALIQLGFRGHDDGYGEGNLHLVSIEGENESIGFGIDTITAMVFDLKGQLIGPILMDSTLSVIAGLEILLGDKLQTLRSRAAFYAFYEREVL